jgi:hypothetical protein
MLSLALIEDLSPGATSGPYESRLQNEVSAMK